MTIQLPEIEKDDRGIPYIDHWMKGRLELVRGVESADLPQDAKEGENGVHDTYRTPDFLRKLIESHINHLRKAVFEGCEFKLVTVRDGNTRAGSFLRPLYAEPGMLYEYFSSPDYLDPLDHSKKDPFEPRSPFVREAPKILEPASEIRVAEYDLRALSVSSGSSDALFSFDRLKKFLASPMLKENNYFGPAVGIPLETGNCCIAVKRNVVTGVIVFLVAIYYTKGDGLEIDLVAAAKAIQSMFKDISHVLELDSALFRAEGLALIARLAPVFQNEKVCPADKLGLAIESISRLLGQHLIGFDHSSAEIKGANPIVTFIEFRFQRTHEYGNERFVYHPLLSIYPPVYRELHPLPAFLISHPRVPAFAKLLLIKYFKTGAVKEIAEAELESEEISLSHLYDHSMFGKHQERAKAVCDSVNQSRDQLVLSEVPETEENRGNLDFRQFVEQSKEFWNDVNVNIGAEGKTRSIAAFVIEGQNIQRVYRRPDGTSKSEAYKSLPRGILAIESKLVGSFVENDVRNLRDIAAALATLIRSLRHPNACYNYDYGLRQAADPDIVKPEDVGEDDSKQILSLMFYINRLDGFILSKLRSEFKKLETFDGGNNIFTSIRLTPENIERLSSALLDSIESDRSSTAIVIPYNNDEARKTGEEQILRLRREKFIAKKDQILDLCKSLNPASKHESFGAALKFLSSVPANYVWAGYHESLSQALADRAFTKDPDFVRLTPGYSADAMFLAAVAQEIHQVVKLSSKKKLEKERQQYRKYVRYRLPNAARIPGAGFSVDSDGSQGVLAGQGKLPEIEGIHSYGALVSDLVDGGLKGQSHSLTLLRCLAESSHASGKGLRLGDLMRAAFVHFDVGRGRWENIDDNMQQEFRRRWDTTDIVHRGELVRLSYRFGGAPAGHDDTSGYQESVRDRMKLVLSEDATCRLGLTKILFALDSAIAASRKKICGDQRVREQDESRLFRNVYNSVFASGGQVKLADARDDLAKIAICHGDLNPKNMVWSPVFRRFFLIDFEYTDLGVRGTDQWKLVCSMICDLYGEFVYRNSAREPSPIDHDIEQAIILIDVVSDEFERNRSDVEAIKGVLGKFISPEKSFVDRADGWLALLISAVISSLARPERGDNLVRSDKVERLIDQDKVEDYFATFAEAIKVLADDNHSPGIAGSAENSVWSLMVACAAAREFSYSCKEFVAKAEVLLPIAEEVCGVNELERSKIDIEAIINKLEFIRRNTSLTPKAVSSSEVYKRHSSLTLDHLRLVSRFLISFLLLLAACSSGASESESPATT